MDSPSSPTSPCMHGQMDWDHLNGQRKRIKNFLLALTYQSIGQGLVLYDDKNFALLPRSNWFNSMLLQRAVTAFDPRATFEKTREAFVDLLTATEDVKNRILSIETTNEDIKGDNFYLNWLDLIQIIEVIAQRGLEQLNNNYLSQSKDQKAASLLRAGHDAFNEIRRVSDNLSKIFACKTTLQSSILLKERHYDFASEKLIQKGSAYLTDASKVVWSVECGVKIEKTLLKHCIKDFQKKPLLNKTTIQSAAKRLKIPQQATPFFTQNGTTAWTPHRPSCHIGQPFFEKIGVWGTCERSKGLQDNLCNLYSKWDEKLKKMVVSTGAIDTSLKASQICLLITQLNEKSFSKRWILHQLNNHSNESTLQKNVIAQVQWIQKSKRDIDFLHINTCFNIGTEIPGDFENHLSLKKTNLISLAQIGSFILEDLQTLLKGETALLGNEWAQLQTALLNIQRIIQPPLEKSILPQIEAVSQTETQILENVIESPTMDFNDTNDSIEDLVDKIEIPERDPSEIKAELKDELIELEKMIKNFSAFLVSSINSTQKKEAFQKGILICNTYQILLSLQLSIKGAPHLSRASEIELFLLLYRLLGLHVIISCKSGLDRTGAVVAMEDSLSLMEKNLTKYYLDTPSENDITEEMCRVRAWDDMFDMIMHLDERRKAIFHISNQVAAPFLIVRDCLSPNDLNLVKNTENLRDKILLAINNQPKAEKLKLVLYYLENIGAHLLGSAQIKTFNSTALCGVKYNHDAGLVESWISANPHPPQRLPQFIFVGNIPIQLLDFNEGWGMGQPSITLTKIAEILYLRLSQLRGS